MKYCVLLIWTGCILAITVSLFHFVWAATVRERILTLALLLTAVSHFRSPR